jgi:hypothetical protein
VRFFKRNFVLHFFNKVYLIINDMLHITNCTSEQAVVSFPIQIFGLELKGKFLERLPGKRRNIAAT